MICISLCRYDYGARMYDPAVGRWNGVDALSEMYSAYSPFAYVLNNPIRLIDPDGMRVNDAGQARIDKMIEKVLGTSSDNDTEEPENENNNPQTSDQGEKTKKKESGEGSSNGEGDKDKNFVTIELNFKFGFGYESSFNIMGYGLKQKYALTQDWMTFTLSDKNGFNSIPYRKVTGEINFGHALLNAGGGFDYSGKPINKFGKFSTLLHDFRFDSNNPPFTITPIDIHYFKYGVGFDFSITLDGKAVWESYNRILEANPTLYLSPKL